MPAEPSTGRRRSPEDLVRALRAEGIRDRRVLAAVAAVPRAGFVPAPAAGEVGTGLGFQTAILARLVGAQGVAKEEPGR